MEFEEKYISTTDNTTRPDPEKIVLSDDAYAIGDMINKLMKEISFRFGKI